MSGPCVASAIPYSHLIRTEKTVDAAPLATKASPFQELCCGCAKLVNWRGNDRKRAREPVFPPTCLQDRRKCGPSIEQRSLSAATRPLGPSPIPPRPGRRAASQGPGDCRCRTACIPRRGGYGGSQRHWSPDKRRSTDGPPDPRIRVARPAFLLLP